jgi:23S rRNA (guanosine2251-2'-O)-methyltransferase
MRTRSISQNRETRHAASRGHVRGARHSNKERDNGKRFLELEQGAVEENPEQLEGRHPVLEALKAGREINKILVAEGADKGSAAEILAVARERGIVIQRVPRAKLETIAQSRNHQGIIAYLAAKEYVELETLIERASRSERPGLLVILDEIEDPYNFGSILRTAEGAGAHGVVIPKRRAVPLTATVAKASAGAIEHMPVARVGNIGQALETLKKAGFWVIGTDVDAPQLYTQADLNIPLAVVIGNEGKGLGEVVKKRCDFLVRLPMVGSVQSLNASVATGILLYEILRQRGNTPGR